MSTILAGILNLNVIFQIPKVPTLHFSQTTLVHVQLLGKNSQIMVAWDNFFWGGGGGGGGISNFPCMCVGSKLTLLLVYHSSLNLPHPVASFLCLSSLRLTLNKAHTSVNQFQEDVLRIMPIPSHIVPTMPSMLTQTQEMYQR